MFLPAHLPTNRWLILKLFVIVFITSCKKDMHPVAQEKRDEVLSAFNSPFGNYWSELSTPDVQGSPVTEEYHMSFSLNKKVYVVVNAYNQLWEYDPATSQWSLIQNPFFTFDSYRYRNVFTNGNNVYFLNGTSKSVKEYNVLTNQWTDKANFPGLAKEAGTSCNTNSKGYIIGGTNGEHPGGYAVTLSENWEYDFSNDTWTQKANTPGYSRYNSASFAVADNIYFGTGISIIIKFNPGTSQISWVPFMNSDWWEYNTIQNTWTQKTSFGGGTRQYTRGFVIGNKIYLGLGSSGYFTGIKSDLWSYDPFADSWTQRSIYPPGNNPYPPFLTMVGAGNHGYAINRIIDDFWKYTPPAKILPNNMAIQ